MKKDRNCGGATPYPVYPTYPSVMPMMNQGMGMMQPGMNPMMNQGMMPMTGQNMMSNQGIGMPNNIVMPTVPSSNTMSGMNSDYSTLSNQVNNLERRVSRLESMMNSSNNMTPKYSESNYYMV